MIQQPLVRRRRVSSYLNSLTLMVAVALLPLFGAFGAYLTGMGVPSAQVNQGGLIRPLMSLEDVGLRPAQGAEDATRRWQVLLLTDFDCGAACSAVLEPLARVQLSLGRLADRVAFGHYVWQAASRTASSQLGVRPSPQFSTWLEQYPQNRLLVVADPHGNLVLSYALQPGLAGQLAADLKRLLRAAGGH